jgi:hypothetical protein
MMIKENIRAFVRSHVDGLSCSDVIVVAGLAGARPSSARLQGFKGTQLQVDTGETSLRQQQPQRFACSPRLLELSISEHCAITLLTLDYVAWRFARHF